MRVGNLQDAASLVLLLLGALFVAAAFLNPLSSTHWGVPTLVLYFLMGITLWRSGQLIRRGQQYGYPLAVAILLIVLLGPFLFGRHPSFFGAVCDVGLVGLVGAAWWRARRAPDA